MEGTRDGDAQRPHFEPCGSAWECCGLRCHHPCREWPQRQGIPSLPGAQLPKPHPTRCPAPTPPLSFTQNGAWRLKPIPPQKESGCLGRKMLFLVPFPPSQQRNSGGLVEKSTTPTPFPGFDTDSFGSFTQGPRVAPGPAQPGREGKRGAAEAQAQQRGADCAFFFFFLPGFLGALSFGRNQHVMPSTNRMSRLKSGARRSQDLQIPSQFKPIPEYCITLETQKPRAKLVVV